MKGNTQYMSVPPELKSKVNNVKNRILFLSPSVLSGEEREARKDDFESLANSNIGVGGFGKVYKVRHKQSKNVFAIKVINKAKIIEHDLVEQIKLEVKIMYNLNHEHIVKLYNHYEDDDNFYLILQYCSKGQLYTMLKREGRLNERLTAQYLREVISAVQYLHSLDPPIIHRDIKPENILLDSNNQVKLGDFGWSNFFNEDRRRLTYCGTPEYLAPEMIKQCGHDKSLDIWNLGVLMFELLTGTPPFEGSNQNELFENILNFRIKWPKGFPGVARDLVAKLLKTNPAERISLEEVLNHPWFKNNPPLKPVGGSNHAQDNSAQAAQPKKLNLESDIIQKGDYQVVSKPSMANKAEAQNETRQSQIIEKKLQQVNANMNSTEQSGKDNTIEDLNNKLVQCKKELNDLKVNYTMKCKENEMLTKEVQELKETLNNKNQYNSKDNADIRKLQEEIQKLRSLNKNRDEIITQMENQNKNLRETETQLKMTQNDFELLQNQNKGLEMKVKDLQEKLDQMDSKLSQQKEKAFQAEKEKEQVTIEFTNKIELLQYKLLNKAENDSTTSGDSASGGGQFKELLSLCKSDLDEILNRLKSQSQNDGIEDQLRRELLDQSKKMNELKSQQEKQIYDLTNENFQKIDKLQQKYEQEKKQSIAKIKEELGLKNDRIKELEKNEKRLLSEKEKSESLSRQMRELQERIKNLTADRDIIENDKKYMDDKIKKYDEKIMDLEYQLRKK